MPTQSNFSTNHPFPELPPHIPIGDMPGDSVQITQSHEAKAKRIFPELMRRLQPFLQDGSGAGEPRRAVLSVYGGSGVGKSEIASVLAYYLNYCGIENYLLSGDNYPRRIPQYNDAERLRIFHQAGTRGLIQAGEYCAELSAVLPVIFSELTASSPIGSSANFAGAENININKITEMYRSAGMEALRGYLGGDAEIDFDEINQVISCFRSASESCWLKRMGRSEESLWYDAINFSETRVLIIEWTHGNNPRLRGIDIPIYLYSTPEETLAHRLKRQRDKGADSPFLEIVLGIEQNLLEGQAENASLIVQGNGELISFAEFRSRTKRPQP